jgi:mono/diheme cytochrome c family protein
MAVSEKPGEHMTINRTKLFAVIFFAFPLFAVAMFNTKPVRVAANNLDDAPTVYKAKCAMCHSPKAEKFFDPAKTDDDHVQIILKGKKGEKPPYMPGFEAKGMTEDEAKGLAAYMKGLRTPAN